MNVVFLGSADFGIPALDGLLAAGHKIATVVTLPPAPKGRGRALTATPVDVHASGRGIPVIRPVDIKDFDLRDELARLDADVFVVVAFRILPSSVFTVPPLGTLNIHASLLPRFRGPAPIQRAIESGETETGVTIFRIDAGVDTGCILAQRRTPIDAEETTPELYSRLSLLGSEALIEVLDDIRSGKASPLPQVHERATPAPKLKKPEGRIAWTLPATTIFNRIRAFKPFPGTFTTLNGSVLGIEWALPAESDSPALPGTVISATPEGFTIRCGQGALRILQVKPEGKHSMTAADYARGHHVEEGGGFA